MSTAGDPSLPQSGRAPIRRQAVYWMLTIPHHGFTPYLPSCCAYIKGQLERGDGGFLHWQVLVVFKAKQSLLGIRRTFGEWHAEPTRSAASSDYVWKDATAVAETRFELGRIPFQRNNEEHWAKVWEHAVKGELLEIPADIRVQVFYY